MVDLSTWISEDGINVWQILRTLIQFVAVATVIAGVVIYRKKKTDVVGDRLLAAILPFAVLSTSLALLYGIARGVGWWWSATRLAKIAGVAAGIELYTLPYVGRIGTAGYGPLAEFAYAPALLGRTPLFMLLIGVCLSIVFIFIPFLLFTSNRKDYTIDRITFVSITTLFLLYATYNNSLHYVLYSIHADAPAIGTVFLSVFFISRGLRHNCTSTLFIGGILAALAFFVKQPTVFAGGAIVAYVLFVSKWKYIRTVLYGCGVGVIIGLIIIISISSLNAYYYNAFLRFSEHALIGDLRTVTFSLLGYVTFLSVPIMLNLLTTNSITWINRLRDSSYESILFVVAIAMIPITIAGTMKDGGDINVFAYVIYPLMVSALFSFLRLTKPPTENSGTKQSESSIQPASIRSVVISMLLVFLSANYYFFSQSSVMAGTMQSVRSTSEVRAYQYLNNTHENVYMPVNRLSQVLVNKKLYHATWELLEMERVRGPIGDEWFFAGAPSSPDVIAFPKNESLDPFRMREMSHILSFYPDYVVSNDTTGDAYWIEYRTLSSLGCK